MKQLKDQTFYIKMNRDLTNRHTQQVYDLLWQICDKNEISEKLFINLVHSKCRTARFYHLPKIHKCLTPGSVPGRPIFSGNICLTEKMSSLVEEHIKSFVKLILSYINDTRDFINKIEGMQNLPTHFYIVKQEHLKLILHCHNFTFNNEYLLQAGGTITSKHFHGWIWAQNAAWGTTQATHIPKVYWWHLHDMDWHNHRTRTVLSPLQQLPSNHQIHDGILGQEDIITKCSTGGKYLTSTWNQQTNTVIFTSAPITQLACWNQLHTANYLRSKEYAQSDFTKHAQSTIAYFENAATHATSPETLQHSKKTRRDNNY